MDSVMIELDEWTPPMIRNISFMKKLARLGSKRVDQSGFKFPIHNNTPYNVRQKSSKL